MHELKPENPPADDLFWTAAQYAADDLPDETAAAFEQLLETDQSAREALAQAVGLSAAVAQVEAERTCEPTVVPVRAARPSVAAWFALAAACVVLAFAYGRRPASDRNLANVAPSPAVADAQSQLAVAWVEEQTAEELEADLAVVVASPFDVASLDDEVEQALELPTLELEPAAPDWLIAALVDAEGASTRGEN